MGSRFLLVGLLALAGCSTELPPRPPDSAPLRPRLSEKDGLMLARQAMTLEKQGQEGEALVLYQLLFAAWPWSDQTRDPDPEHPIRHVAGYLMGHYRRQGEPEKALEAADLSERLTHRGPTWCGTGIEIRRQYWARVMLELHAAACERAERERLLQQALRHAFEALEHENRLDDAELQRPRSMLGKVKRLSREIEAAREPGEGQPPE